MFRTGLKQEGKIGDLILKGKTGNRGFLYLLMIGLASSNPQIPFQELMVVTNNTISDYLEAAKAWKAATNVLGCNFPQPVEKKILKNSQTSIAAFIKGSYENEKKNKKQKNPRKNLPILCKKK